MSDLNKPGCSRSNPSTPSGRIAIPPRSLPNQLDAANPFNFDPRQVPFSPTSPGKSSPSRPKTMKEYEDELVSLRRENFNLKVRIYFIEQNRFDANIPKDVDELRSSYMDLKVEHESVKKELEKKEDLLLNTYRAIEAQKQQLEAGKADHDAERQMLESKLDSLEKELKEYQTKFMETSVQLDDTNAMYALTFGLNNKKDLDRGDYSDEKIKGLENDLEAEKRQVLVLQQHIDRLNLIVSKDQSSLQHLQNTVDEMKEKLKATAEEKKQLQSSAERSALEVKSLTKKIEKKIEALKLKEDEIETLKTIITDFEKELNAIRCRLQDKEQPPSKISTDLSKRLKSLLIENNKLRQQLESRSPKTSRERSTESTPLERKLSDKLCESQGKVDELTRELTQLNQQTSRANLLIQSMLRENKCMKKEIDALKAVNQKLIGSQDSSQEGRQIQEMMQEMGSEKDKLIVELKQKVEELIETVKLKECQLAEYKEKLEFVPASVTSEGSKTSLELLDQSSLQREKEALLKALEEKKKEVESLQRELKKKTFNLQGLVNTELWDKNREIEKLNKVCERKHVEVLTLQKQVREYQLNLVQDKVSNFMSLQSGLFTEDKENLQPVSDPTVQLRQLAEEKRLLTRKVEELQARLLNTPERDVESLLVQSLRAERDQAEKLRKEAVNACVLLTTRLQELVDFLDSLLPSLCGKKRRVVQQAVERSRELSRSLTVAAEDSLLHCSAWTDLQPSLYVPLLPDISTVDFWSGDEDEAFSGQEVARLKSQVETLTEEVKQKDGEIARFQSEKKSSESFFLQSVLGLDDQHFLNNMENIVENDICDMKLSECSFVECSDQNAEDNVTNKLLPEVKSANIGKITLTSKKKDSSNTINDTSKSKKEKDGSEYETWSEPDRDVSYARMGLKDSSPNVNKALQFNFNDTTETADSAPKSPSSRRSSEIHRLQRKVNNLEQVNEALRSELMILHHLAPPASSRQDKATSIEFSRQGSFCVPSHILEEIRVQREKLEASLFHNDYIRRQLESTVSSLRRSQCGPQDQSLREQENASVTKLTEVTNRLECAENELTSLKTEKEQQKKEMEQLQHSLQQKCNELLEKQCALLELEKESTQRLKDVEEQYKEKCSQLEENCLQLEQKCKDVQREKEQLLDQILETNKKISKLQAEIDNYEQEGKKNKRLQEELNLQLQQSYRQKDELQKVITDQEQLLADAERERQELATQLIARDRQVSELQKQLSNVELTSNELEAALRSQLDIATHQCSQFEAKLRDLDSCNKRREREAVNELRRQLDAANCAHSEAVLQYTRVANENIRLQSQLRARQHEPNQLAHAERVKYELEMRVAELETVNAELGTRLASLNIVKPLYSDYETDAGTSGVGRSRPPPLTLGSPPRPAPPTSDYLSDQEGVLSSPQVQTRSIWSPHASTSPDLGIDSDHGRLSSLESHVPRSTAVSLRGTPIKDLMKLEEENTQLRRNLQKTRLALEETLSQLTAANQHKRQYEAQLSAASQHNAKVERAICRQLHKTHSILKKARVNLEEDGKSDDN